MGGMTTRWSLTSSVWLDRVAEPLIGSHQKCIGKELAACGEVFTGNDIHEHGILQRFFLVTEAGKYPL